MAKSLKRMVNELNIILYYILYKLSQNFIQQQRWRRLLTLLLLKLLLLCFSFS